MKRAALFVVAILVLPISVLGYGYWFGASHGSLLIDVMDVSDREHPRPVSTVALALLNSKDQVLAEARAASPPGVVYISSPGAYSCWDVGQRAPFSTDARREWDRCFERQSRWITTWIRNVTSVNLRSGTCWLQHIPVSVTEHPDTQPNTVKRRQSGVLSETSKLSICNWLSLRIVTGEIPAWATTRLPSSNTKWLTSPSGKSANDLQDEPRTSSGNWPFSADRMATPAN